MRSVQIATSVSWCDAHDFGGGAGARASASRPAAIVTSVTRPVGVARRVPRHAVPPQHREMRLGELVGSRQVEPDLEQLDGVRGITIAQREHLGVNDAATGGEPLHVSAAEARRRAERVGMVDEALPDDGDRLEAPVRMLREAGHDVAVVHPPAVPALEVLADGAARERGVGPHPLVAPGVRVVVMDAEQERIVRRPREAQRRDGEHGVSSGTVRGGGIHGGQA